MHRLQFHLVRTLNTGTDTGLTRDLFVQQIIYPLNGYNNTYLPHRHVMTVSQPVFMEIFTIPDQCYNPFVKIELSQVFPGMVTGQ